MTEIYRNLYHRGLNPTEQDTNYSNEISYNQVNLCTKFMFLKMKQAGLCPVAMDIYHHFFDCNK